VLFSLLLSDSKGIVAWKKPIWLVFKGYFLKEAKEKTKWEAICPGSSIKQLLKLIRSLWSIITILQYYSEEVYRV